MKYRFKRRTIILIIMIISMTMTLSYALLQTNMIISGSAIVDSNGVWNIYFDNLSTYNSGSSLSNSANISGTSLTFDVTLIKPLDSVTYVFDVINDGKVDALLSSISLFNEDIAYKNDITYELTYYDGSKITPGKDILEKQTSKKLKLVIKYADVNIVTVQSKN